MKKIQMEPCHEALYTRLIAFERKLQRKATSLEGKCLSTDNHEHWKARGGLQTLREVTRYLREMRHRSYAEMYDYLNCLETSVEDAKWDVARLPRPRRGMPIARWKAEGEYECLSKVCPELADILNEYAPMDEALLAG